MENLLLLLASRLAGRTAEPKFKRYLVGRTGCTALLPSAQPVFHIHTTADGERVYFHEQQIAGVTLGLIAVDMKEKWPPEKAETILVHYLSRIRKPFGVACNTGMEAVRISEALSVTDYWQGDDEIDWKVRGCSDGKMLAVLYAKNISACPVNEHDAFLNGFRFSPLR